MSVFLRTATTRDVPAIHGLISAHLEEGHLLPRQASELATHAARFVVATRRTSRGRQQIIACGELAPLSASVAEVRSLVVDRSARALGIGRQLITELQRRAAIGGFDQLCAFTHNADYFVRKGFTIVPHAAVPEKIEIDCRTCPLFRRCGQYAVVLPVRDLTRESGESAVAQADTRG